MEVLEVLLVLVEGLVVASAAVALAAAVLLEVGNPIFYACKP